MTAISVINRPPSVGRPTLLKRILFGRVSTALAFLTIICFACLAIFAPWIAPYDPLKQSFIAINKYPSSQYWLGTDQFGRDVLSRLIYGSRTSLMFGLIAPACAAVVGTTLGVLAGYFGGLIDRILSKFIDLLMAFPELLLAIIVSAALGGGFWNVVFVLTVAFVPGFARVARASTLAVRNEPYIEASMAIGVRTRAIIIRHVLPNISASVMLLFTLWIASAIRLEAALSFLGIGTPPPNPSWGNIIREGLGNVFGSPWPIIGAGLAITMVVLAINLLGDATRDALDPNNNDT